MTSGAVDSVSEAVTRERLGINSQTQIKPPPNIGTAFAIYKIVARRQCIPGRRGKQRRGRNKEEAALGPVTEAEAEKTLNYLYGNDI